MDKGANLASLQAAVSAGETLPAPVFEEWTWKTGKLILDGIGSTEILHLHHQSLPMPSGATGKPVAGYEARIVDDDMNDVADGTIGHLWCAGRPAAAIWPTPVRPNTCATAGPDRRRFRARQGWGIPLVARADDMIISSGYNIAGPEVEQPAGAPTPPNAPWSVPSEERGRSSRRTILKPDAVGDEACIRRLQDHVKAIVAPYKYPCSVKFVAALPKTLTGKIQRFKLRV
jgi:2-aminobenzoate-CoA ligase